MKITFIEKDSSEITVDGKIGDTLLDVAKQYDIDLEGKANIVNYIGIKLYIH